MLVLGAGADGGACRAAGLVGNGNRLDLPNEPGCVALTPLGRKIAQIDPWGTPEVARL